MEARAHPRTTLAIPVGLFCADKNRYYHRKIKDISVGGLFVAGAPCARNGMALDVIVNAARQSPEQTQRYESQVVRNSAGGFACKFTHLDECKTRTLEDIIWPQWDGENMFEGLLIVAAHEHADDLAGWLRLTSLLCNQYRRCCKGHKYDQGKC